MRPERDDPQTGRKAFLEPGESGQGLVIRRDPFWKDETERLTYENAAEANPRHAGEKPLAYIQRLAELAGAELKGAAAKRMPSARLPYKDADDVLQRLREQADEITAKRSA